MSLLLKALQRANIHHNLTRSSNFVPLISVTSNRLISKSSIKLDTETTSTSNTNTNSENTNTSENESKKNDQQDELPIEERILKNAMKYVPQFGFTRDAISQGAIEAGFSPATESIFKKGEFDLIDYFYKNSNKRLEEHLTELKQQNTKLGISELIRTALVFRLKLLEPYIEHWPRAMSVMSFNPYYAVEAIENLLRLCDEIWHQAGDKSTDLNWYSKRITLAAIYKTTELFMITDKSENFQETWKFLDRRFADLRSYASLQRGITDCTSMAEGAFTVLKNIANLR